MALRAMGFRSVVTDPATTVLRWRNQFQMIEVDTCSVSAEMVDYQPVRDGSSEEIPHGSMDVVILALPFGPAVPRGSLGACPDNARPIWLSFLKETSLPNLSVRQSSSPSMFTFSGL